VAQKARQHHDLGPGLIADDGEVSDETTVEFLRNYMSELYAFVVRVLTVLPRGT
jgi:chromate reductase